MHLKLFRPLSAAILLVGIFTDQPKIKAPMTDQPPTNNPPRSHKFQGPVLDIFYMNNLKKKINVE